jgi:lipopolysaccharide/colanic/teichoic acid biosynthesis glycosyltransferase
MIRFLDVLIAVCAVVLLSPVMVVVAICILLETGRPVLYRQTRIGQDGREFAMLKFRSMRVNADSKGPYFTEVDDPRITQVGKFIRKTSIDELPQLVNVLRGDMSIVGPRPNLPIQNEQLSPDDAQLRNSVRPGITGLAQIRGRSRSALDDRLISDREWVRHRSVCLYFRVILRTFTLVLARKGSN